ncbi:MAG TPA: radical SAM protein [Dissulfurispiraceae bacterium]|nr:radical SAM protein [Dissulfurispiraceae bacterium]
MVRSLYIHIPFCLRKCPYCDFCSVPYDEEQARRTIAAVMRELEMRSLDACELSTVYIGGGTPTIVPASELIRLIG